MNLTTGNKQISLHSPATNNGSNRETRLGGEGREVGTGTGAPGSRRSNFPNVQRGPKNPRGKDQRPKRKWAKDESHTCKMWRLNQQARPRIFISQRDANGNAEMASLTYLIGKMPNTCQHILLARPRARSHKTTQNYTGVSPSSVPSHTGDSPYTRVTFVQGHKFVYNCARLENSRASLRSWVNKQWQADTTEINVRAPRLLWLTAMSLLLPPTLTPAHSMCSRHMLWTNE